MEYTDLEKIRLQKIENMRTRGIEPYPTRAHPTHTLRQALDLFAAGEQDPHTEPSVVTLAGRIRSLRAMGKLVFAHIEDGTGKIQLMLRINELGEEKLRQFKEDFDLGDFVEATGALTRTRTGEISLLVTETSMLSKEIPPAGGQR